jgi:hypothetical protein
MVEETKFVFGKLFWCDSIHAALSAGLRPRGGSHQVLLIRRFNTRVPADGSLVKAGASVRTLGKRKVRDRTSVLLTIDCS